MSKQLKLDKHPRRLVYKCPFDIKVRNNGKRFRRLRQGAPIRYDDWYTALDNGTCAGWVQVDSFNNDCLHQHVFNFPNLAFYREVKQ